MCVEVPRWQDDGTAVLRRGLCPRRSSLRRCHQLRLLLGCCIPLLTKLLTSGRRLGDLDMRRHLMITHHRRHRSLRLTHNSLPTSYRKARLLLLVLWLMLGTLLGRRRYRRRHRLGQDLLRDLLVMLSSDNYGGRRRRRRRSRGRRRRDDLLQKLLLLLLLLLRLLIIRLRLRRMRYDRLTVLRLLLLLLNKLRTLKYLHYLIAWAHYGILLNNRLRRRWPQLMTAGTRRRNDDATAVTATTGRDQDLLLTSTPGCTTPVGARNRTGTGNGTSHKGHGLALLLLLDMVLKCFFRRFRAT